MSMPIGLWYINEPIHTHKQARTKTHTQRHSRKTLILGFCDVRYLAKIDFYHKLTSLRRRARFFSDIIGQALRNCKVFIN